MFYAQDWYSIPNKIVSCHGVYADKHLDLCNDSPRHTESSRTRSLLGRWVADVAASRIHGAHSPAQYTRAVSAIEAVGSPCEPQLRLYSGSSGTSIGSDRSCTNVRTYPTERAEQAVNDLDAGEGVQQELCGLRGDRIRSLLLILTEPEREAGRLQRQPKYKTRAPKPLQLDRLVGRHVAALELAAQVEAVNGEEEEPVVTDMRYDDRYVVGHGREKETRGLTTLAPIRGAWIPYSLVLKEASFVPPSPSIRTIPLPSDCGDTLFEGASVYSSRSSSPGAQSYASHVTRINYPENDWDQCATLSPLKAFEPTKLCSLADFSSY